MLLSSRSKSTEKLGKKKGFSRNEKIAGIVILFIAIWAVYSFTRSSQPITPTTTTSLTSGATSGLDFTLPVVDQNGLTGQRISLSQFRGKIVFLEFMEPWCGHCQNMMPTLERLYQEFGAQNVVFLSVSGPWAGPSGAPATAEDTAKFIQDYNSRLTYVYDSSGTVFNNFGVTSTPTFFIIGQNGEILQTHQGEVAYDVLAADLNRFKP